MMCLGVVGSTLDFCQDDFMHCVLMFHEYTDKSHKSQLEFMSHHL